MAVIIVIKLQSKGRCSWNEPRATELKDNKKKIITKNPVDQQKDAWKQTLGSGTREII